MGLRIQKLKMLLLLQKLISILFFCCNALFLKQNVEDKHKSKQDTE